jgi:protein O-GlcNAc transferase
LSAGAKTGSVGSGMIPEAVAFLHQAMPEAALRGNSGSGRSRVAHMTKTPTQRSGPDSFVVATFNQALTAHRAGDLARAESLYRLVLAGDARQFDAMHMLGIVAGQRGDYREGVRRLTDALKIKPEATEGYINLGRMQAELKDYAAAGASYRKALSLNPNLPLAHSNFGIILRRLGNCEEAVLHCDRAIALAPNYPEAWTNRGNALFDLGRNDEALESYDRALALAPGLAEAMLGRGNALLALERFEEALASYDKALSLRPDNADCHAGRGLALHALKRFDGALASLDRALAIAPENGDGWFSRGNALQELRRFAEAVASYDKVLAIRPDFAEAYYGRGRALQALKRFDDALADFDAALAMKPFFADCLYSYANALRELNRLEDAIAMFGRLHDFAPDHDFLKGMLLYTKMFGGDWDQFESLADAVKWDVECGQKVVEPFVYQAISTSAQDLQRCAEIFAAARYPGAPAWSGGKYDHGRIRIGYVSGEFRYQATSILIAELFERHDKDRFALYAFDNGWDDGGPLRARINRACDEVVDIASLGDVAASAAIAQRQIDILVNLNGYFGLERTGVFARRCAPVQVNYLGFPGTMGADYMDYIIADAVVIPPEQRGFYTEKVVYLPDSYQANDTKRRLAERMPSRDEYGLPDRAFVFCCFNNTYKITPAIFDIWMRLLAQVEGSVLWLLQHNELTPHNLRSEAEKRSVAPERLVFAQGIPLDEHLARHRLADLFLDTLPYNAHTTANDALWAGLPLVTCSGSTFPGRVAASLLRAAGLDELVAGSLADYEALALKLARDRDLLASIKTRLAHNRDTCALFDSARFARHIEAAYIRMWERSRQGEPPEGFAVERI